MDIREKLYELGAKTTEYYKNKENRFLSSAHAQLSPTIPRETRIKLINTLVEELGNLPIIKTDKGYTLDLEIENPAYGLLSLTTHDITAGLLRGKNKGNALYKSDCPFVNKWVPLVMYALKEKHGLKYEDFWLKGNTLARVLLGKELKDLTVVIIENELSNLSQSSDYIISPLGYKIKKPSTSVDYDDSSEDEARPDFNDKNTRIIRYKSPLISVFDNDYPKNYGIFEDCLSKELMSDLIWHYIIKSKEPEWDGRF